MPERGVPWEEFGSIETMRAMFEAVLGAAPAGSQWIGDDAAVLAGHGDPLLVSVDATVDGVHGELAWMSAQDFGWKGAATAISDIAAMGGVPTALLLSLVCPPQVDPADVAEGVAEISRLTRAPVVGGNVSSGGRLVVSVTAAGTMARAGTTPLRRDRARPGDRVYLTGPLGAAAAGLRVVNGVNGSAAPGPAIEGLVRALRRPVPRVVEGQRALEAGATAAIDISDGLLADAAHVADASGVAIALDAVPVAEGATEDDALDGGEDYELLVVAPEGVDLEHVSVPAEDGTAVRPFMLVGRCSAGSGVTVRGERVRPGGWRHSS